VTDHAGALEAVDRIVNRGGAPKEVLRAVLEALNERGIPALIRFSDGRELGGGSGGVRAPVVLGGERLGELEADADDPAFVERVATLVSPYMPAPALPPSAESRGQTP
jgi:hypothetical protein